MRDREDIIRIVQKLLNVTVDKGANPAEAAGAAEKVQRLLHEHNLTMFDAQTQTLGEGVEEHGLEMGGRLEAWESHLAFTLSEAFGCDSFIRRRRLDDRRTVRAVFVGIRSDAMVCTYLFQSLSQYLVGSSREAGRACGRRGAELLAFRKVFCFSAIRVIKDKLRESRERMDAAPASSALVVVKNQLVERYMKEMHPDLKSGKSCSYNLDDKRAVTEGRIAGEKANLNAGIEGDRPFGRIGGG